MCIRDSLETGQTGFLIAQPTKDERLSLVVRIGDWPAAVTVILCVALGICTRKRDADTRVKAFATTEPTSSHTKEPA